MAKTNTGKVGKVSKGGNGTSGNGEKVLYIAGWNLLMPYDDQRTGRSSPLRFLLFRCPADNTPEGQLYRMARESLKIQPHGFLALAVYDEMLLAYGGNKIATLRGFVVNHRLRTASATEIAQAIGCRSRLVVAAAVRKLLAVGLLVYVARPDFQEAIRLDKTIEVDDRPPCPRRDRLRTGKDPAAPAAPSYRQTPTNPTTATREQPTKPTTPPAVKGAEAEAGAKVQGEARVENGGAKPESRNPSPDGSGKGRRRTLPRDRLAQSSAAIPEPFRKVPEDFRGTLDRRRDTRDEPPEASPLPALGDGRQEPETTATAHGDAHCVTGDGQAGDTPQAGTGMGKPPTADAATATATATATAAALPTVPTEADPGSGATAGQPCAAERGHPAPHAGQAGRQAEAPGKAGPMAIDQCCHAEEFAQQVLALLYPTREDLVEQGHRAQPPQSADVFERRELGSIRSTFEHALVGMDQVQAMRLICHARSHAQATHKKRCKSTRGRLWTRTFHDYLIGTRRAAARVAGPSEGGGP